MQDQRLISKIVRGMLSEGRLSVGERFQKGVKLVSDSARARIALAACNSVGLGARVTGRMRVDNRGHVSIGNALVVNASFVPVELLTGPHGTLTLGDRVWINFGTVIAAKARVSVANGVMIGQHCIISDVEIPEAIADDDAPAKHIEIGEGAWIAGRVTVRPGVKIGAGAIITAGSIVESDIPPGVVAGGIPARALRSATRSAVSTQSSSLNGSPNGHGTAILVDTGTRASEQEAKAAASGMLVSDFTVDELADELRVAGAYPTVLARVAPYGQVAQVLLNDPSPDASDFLVVWTRPESMLPSFGRALQFEEVDERDLLAEVDQFCALVQATASRYKAVFVPTWSVPPWVRGFGMIDMRKSGVARCLLAANLRLSDAVAQSSNVYVLNAERWSRSAGASNASPKGWYLGKVSAPRAVMVEAALDIKAALFGLQGAARKLLVLDLDDTLWGGIVGDVGWEGLRLGGHDPQGEAFVDFQRAIKSLTRRGVVLGIVSKNEESVALEAMRKHPEMVLRENDFVGWKINWNDKARNINELAAQLNLGLQSVVFIDDNPVERARVREALPEVLVPEWPVDKLLYPSAFAKLTCFDAPALSREDAERTRMYSEERQRERLQTEVGSVAEWLKTLQIRVRVEPLGPANLTRATQLLNKTNQMNLSTRRMTESDLLSWSQADGRAFWTVSVSDRFGDSGLTGLISTERQGDAVRVIDFVLSCRVMGRKVEETLAHLAVETARRHSSARVIAQYVPTAKNKPCLSFWQASGFTNAAENEFQWDAQQPYPLPEPIHLEWQMP